MIGKAGRLQQTGVDRPEMAEAAQQTKQMEQTVAVPFVLSRAVEDGADGVGHASGDQPQEPGKPHGRQQAPQADEDRPAAEKLAEHGGQLEALQVHGGGTPSRDTGM